MLMKRKGPNFRFFSIELNPQLFAKYCSIVELSVTIGFARGKVAFHYKNSLESFKSFKLLHKIADCISNK
jgi:hypothetical protein